MHGDRHGLLFALRRGLDALGAAVEIFLPRRLGGAGDAVREFQEGECHPGAGEEQAEADVVAEVAEHGGDGGADEERPCVQRHGGEDGPGDRPQPADDRDGEDGDGEVGGELQGRHRLPGICPEHAGHAGKEAGDGENGELDGGRVGAERGAGALVVPHGEEHPPRVRSPEGRRGGDRQNEHHQGHVVDAAFGARRTEPGAESRWFHRQTEWLVGSHPRLMKQPVGGDHREPQRRDREGQAPDAQGRQPDDDHDRGSYGTTEEEQGRE